MSEKFTSLLAACTLTFVVFAATSPALAQNRPITITAQTESVSIKRVSYRDLNLAKHDDEKILIKRVSAATKEVCRNVMRPEPAFVPEYSHCRAVAWQGARPQIRRAVTRAQQIAANGFSAIAPVAITISVR